MTPAELLDLARKFRAEAEGWEARTKEAGQGWKRSDPDAWRRKVRYWHLMDVTQALYNAAESCEEAARYMDITKAERAEGSPA